MFVRNTRLSDCRSLDELKRAFEDVKKLERGDIKRSKLRQIRQELIVQKAEGELRERVFGFCFEDAAREGDVGEVIGLYEHVEHNARNETLMLSILVVMGEEGEYSKLVLKEKVAFEKMVCMFFAGEYYGFIRGLEEGYKEIPRELKERMKEKARERLEKIVNEAFRNKCSKIKALLRQD